MPFIMAPTDQLPDAPDAVRTTPNSSKRKRSDASVENAPKKEHENEATRDNPHHASKSLHAFLQDLYDLLKRYVVQAAPTCSVS